MTQTETQTQNQTQASVQEQACVGGQVCAQEQAQAEVKTPFLEGIIKRAKADKKTIVLPEGNDERTLVASQKILAQEIADIIILGDVDEIEANAKEANINLTGASIIDYKSAPEREQYIDELLELRRHKGLERKDAEKLIDNELYFAVMLVRAGVADGMVAGACHSTGDVLRPALQILKTASEAKMVSSYFVMCCPNCDYGENGVFVFSDCGLEVQPSSQRLSYIAINAARAFEDMIGAEPRVALLSHSTFGSAKNDDARKVSEAVSLARELTPDLALDGEMQLDAAIVPEVAVLKAPNSDVAGHANVLVFPDLDAANIGYKLVERLAGARAFGPITQGIAAPVNDLSRGCSADDIVGVVAITCVQAQARARAVGAKA